MKGFIAVGATTVALALTACTGSGAHHAAAATDRTATPRVPVSCSQQYRDWTAGDGQGVMDALAAVTSSATSADGHAIQVALERAKPDIARAVEHPIPACADPRGYWTVLLMHVTAAVKGDGSGPTMLADLQNVPELHQQLQAEVKQLT